MSTTPCITLRQPWASLVAQGHKTIETRTHNQFRSLLGQRIFIHAGRSIDRSGFDVAAKHLTPEQLSTLTTGAIIATAFVADARELTEQDETHALIECQTPRFGLVLTGITPIDPIPAKGRLGIWHVERAA